MIIDCHYHHYATEFDPDEKLREMDALGADRVLYGSDGPHGALRGDEKFDMQKELDFVKALLTQEEWEQIGGRNARRLFHLS